METPELGANDLAIFWAKTDREGKTSAYHPLLCHLVDVGMVTQALWRSVLPEAARTAVARALGLGGDDAVRWVSFWSACHDLGKLAPAFQLRDAAARARIATAGFPCPVGADRIAHGFVTTLSLTDLLPKELGLSPSLAARVGTLVGGHHGVFPRALELKDLRRNREAVGRGDWADARRATFHLIATVFGPLPPIPGGIDNATAMVLAGLVSVADWIGSNVKFFALAATQVSPRPPAELNAYTEHARTQAAIALRCLGWSAWSAPGKERSFEALFDLPAPNPTQRAAIKLADNLTTPSLVVVEVPMGEGKTEAALYLADRWRATRGQRGCYVALPTQATTNQMFGRVRDFLDRCYDEEIVNLQLLHGLADLSADFQELRRNGDTVFRLQGIDGAAGRDGASAGVVAAEWFTHRKRGLLSPYGVGTIDQGLLAVLQTRHGFVRLFGLAHKTVVIDEVHAYDTYMSTLLEGLIEWLAALGCSVVLLSATLPNRRRDVLVRAFNRGLGAATPVRLPRASYPRLTWLSATHTGACTVETSARGTKSAAVSWVDGQLVENGHGAFPLGLALVDALADGGCAVVVCNTVRRAQEMFAALKAYFPGVADDGSPELDLLHARYQFAERARRERRALVRFGKPGVVVTDADGTPTPVCRPYRAVLVATQIVEQSLDLDFDLLVTDLAPIDLVLQRTGRLHRHDRVRPNRLATPMVWIIQPLEDEGGCPRFEGGTAHVYDAHVLLRTWLTLRGRATLQVPGDVEELIEDVYADDSGTPTELPPAQREHWDRTRANMVAQRTRDEGLARSYRILPPTHPDDIFEGFCRELEEDDPEVHLSFQALTRLSDLSVPVVFLLPHQHKLANGLDKPGPDLTRLLLGQAVAVADRRIVYDLVKRDVPNSWRESAHLRRHRVVRLSERGTEDIGKYRVRIDGELGLVVEDP